MKAQVQTQTKTPAPPMPAPPVSAFQTRPFSSENELDESPSLQSDASSLFGTYLQRRATTSQIIQPKLADGAQREWGTVSQGIQGAGFHRENNTGLPDHLKTGIETLSGISMDDVRVHYNSPKPAQLQALAYTQGTDIHVAPQQENHLPHEAWHVVQQKQGRVQPTIQMKGVRINDDGGLEREADVMGTKALQMRSPDSVATNPATMELVNLKSSGTIQRYQELNDQKLGNIWLSEGKRFFRSVEKKQDLWAQKKDIEKAESLMAKNKISIVKLSAGKALNFQSQKFHRVVVAERPKKKKKELREKSEKKEKKSLFSNFFSPQPKPKSKPKPKPSGDPFDHLTSLIVKNNKKSLVGINFLIASGNPYERGSYVYGAYAAIQIQLSLKIIELEKKNKKPNIKELIKFLSDWKTEVKKNNNDHDFCFWPTECGGFSRMVMSGEEVTQEDAKLGDRLKVLGLGDLPGPWQNHYAAVIFKDADDLATLESAAGMNEWWFGVYGVKSPEQTFIAKTLLTKLQIGAERDDKYSKELHAYVQARLKEDKLDEFKLPAQMEDTVNELSWMAIHLYVKKLL